jgi:hypothetical protein
MHMYQKHSLFGVMYGTIETEHQFGLGLYYGKGRSSEFIGISTKIYR